MPLEAGLTWKDACKWNQTEDKVVAALVNKLIILNAKYIQYLHVSKI